MAHCKCTKIEFDAKFDHTTRERGTAEMAQINAKININKYVCNIIYE